MPKTTGATADPIEVEVREPEEGEDESPSEPLLDRLENLGEQVTQFVVERPLTAVGIALAVGFIVGRIARR